MAIVGRFGSLHLDEFNEPWEEVAVPPGVLTKVFELTVPTGPAAKTFVVSGLWVSGMTNCTAILKRDTLQVWKGESTPSSGPLNPIFSPGGFIGVPGAVFEVWVEHYHTVPLDWNGNVFGYKRS